MARKLFFPLYYAIKSYFLLSGLPAHSFQIQLGGLVPVYYDGRGYYAVIR